MTELTDLQIDICNEILKYIFNRREEVGRTDLINQLKNHYDDEKITYAIDNILLEYKFIESVNSKIHLTLEGKKVAKSSKGIKEYLHNTTEYHGKLAVYVTILSAIIAVFTSPIAPEIFGTQTVQEFIFWTACIVLFVCLIYVMSPQINYKIKNVSIGIGVVTCLGIIAYYFIGQIESTHPKQEDLTTVTQQDNPPETIQPDSTNKKITHLLHDVRIGKEQWESVKYMFKEDARYIQIDNGIMFFDKDNAFYRIVELINPEFEQIEIGVNYTISKIIWEGDVIDTIVITNEISLL